jgi:hypothetical protein
LFCAAGLFGMVEGIAARAAVHLLAGTPQRPGGGAAAWLLAAGGALAVVAMVLLWPVRALSCWTPVRGALVLRLAPRS